MLKIVRPLVYIIFIIALFFQHSAFPAEGNGNYSFTDTPVEANIMNLENILPKENSPIITSLPEDAQKLPEGRIYKQASRYLSKIDPQTGEKGVFSNYPGLRGANQLIIYTPAFGMRTGTNEFGAEAVVVNNTVVKLSGADSIIPRGGFVISGHGTAKNWIQKNITLGSKIYIDTSDNKITAFITPDTYIFEVEEKIKETLHVIQYYRMMDNCYDSRKANNLLNKANFALKKAEKHSSKFEEYLTQAKEYVNLALQYSIPYNQDELKGVWIRPVEQNQIEICDTVEKLKKTGINTVFLETFYHGTTIYPSKVLESYGVTSQRGEFNRFDPLKIWIKECHKNNIKVYIWFECFYIGNKHPRSSAKHILSVYPQWANTTKELANSDVIANSSAEHNGYFIDPANPEVQKFVGEILTEIVEKYRPDGINLDYIRYPLGAQIKNDFSTGTQWGYTKYARDEFISMYGTDPMELRVSDPLWQKWIEYRQNKITEFVEFARKLTAKNDVKLTAVIFTDRERTLETKLQDWKTWSKKYYVDGLTPLVLTTDKKTAGILIHDIKSQISSYTKLYPGIFVMFMDAPTDELLMQVHEARKMHSDGVVLFDYAHFKQEYQEALGVRVFNSKKRY